MLRRAVYLLAFGALVASGSADGAILQISVQRGSFYDQTTAAGPPALRDYQYLLGVATTAIGDVGAARVTFGGAAPPIDLTSVSDPGSGSTLWGAGASLASQAALDAAVPPGPATFEISGGTLGTGSAIVNTLPDIIPTAIPQFDAATFSAMENIDPSSDFLVSFNLFTPHPLATLALNGVLYTSADHAGGIIAPNPTDTSILIPAGTLRPNTEYTFALVFQNFIYTPILAPGPFLGAFAVNHGARGTTTSAFTTLPEPTAFALVLVMAVCRRRFR